MGFFLFRVSIGSQPLVISLCDRLCSEFFSKESHGLLYRFLDHHREDCKKKQKTFPFKETVFMQSVFYSDGENILDLIKAYLQREGQKDLKSKFAPLHTQFFFFVAQRGMQSCLKILRYLLQSPETFSFLGFPSSFYAEERRNSIIHIPCWIQ